MRAGLKKGKFLLGMEGETDISEADTVVSDLKRR